MNDRVPRPGLEHLTWPQVPQDPILLVPLGSTEQHGPHLPAGTDAFVAAAVAAAVAVAIRDAPQNHAPVVVAPTLGYGASGEHEGFAGTISIGHQALVLLLVELGRSAFLWARRVLVVNGHGGNLPTVRDAVVQLRSEGRDAAWVPCACPGADPHAGRFETSLMLAIAPWTVRADVARPGVTEPMATLMPRLRADGVRAVSPSGVLGDPSGASAAEGRAMLAAMTGEVVGRLRRWAPDDAGLLARDPAFAPELPSPGSRA
jgi:mycofactocin system creatininase family protein